jgi:hypothetical protein
MTADGLLLVYVLRRIQLREWPEPTEAQQDAMSEILVGLIANLIVWTLVLVIYCS